jgi:hypothetical protein
MAISITWSTRVIYVPQADLTYISGVLYELDVDALRLSLRDLEDGEEGMAFPTTHRHNTQVVLAGVTYARSVEIINGYAVEFEDGQYVVRCVGANHNLSDVKVANQVSLIIGNSAGLISAGGSGASASELWSYGTRALTDKVGFTLSAAYDPAKSAASQASVDAVATIVSALQDEAFGKWDIDTSGSPHQLILYKIDDSELARFNLTELPAGGYKTRTPV